MAPALYKFEGKITAVTPLAVCRPGDNFVSPRGSDKMGRLPRIGVKRDDAPVYFPATTLRRLFRESARNLVRTAIQRVQDGPPFSLQTHMMLTSGIDVTNRVLEERSSGLIDGESELRLKNPLLSVFGRWKLAGHLHVGNAMPMDPNCAYVEGAGARQNDFERDPRQAAFLSPTDVRQAMSYFDQDSSTSKDISKIKAIITNLKRELKSSPSDESASIYERIADAELEIKSIKATKDGSSESIKRPLEGFEAIKQGAEMAHSMRLDNCSDLELGFFLACMKEACRHPLVGGHRNLGCGEIRAQYDLLGWSADADRPGILGAVKMGFDGFILEGKALVQALYLWENQAKEILKYFDFDRFLVGEN